MEFKCFDRVRIIGDPLGGGCIVIGFYKDGTVRLDCGGFVCAVKPEKIEKLKFTESTSKATSEGDKNG